MMSTRRLPASNRNLNDYSVGNNNYNNDHKLSLRRKGPTRKGPSESVGVSKNPKLCVCDSLRYLNLREIRGANVSRKCDLEIGLFQNMPTNACLRKVKEANTLSEVAELHSAAAFHRVTRTGSIREVILQEDSENYLDAAIETVMYEEYNHRMKTSSSYHRCDKEPQHCNSVHGRHLEICHPLQRILDGYCNQALWTCAVEYINIFLIGYEYPPPIVILHLLDFVLNSHELPAVVKTMHTLSHFISTHPPYVSEMRQYYIDLMTMDNGNACAKIGKNGILQSIVNLMKEIQDDVVVKKFMTAGSFTNSVVEEKTAGDRYSYETLPKEQKLQRLIWMLEWIAHAFEIDFIHFLAKYQDSPSEYIKKEETQPLILATLWKGASTEDTAEHCECCIISLIEVWIKASVLVLPLFLHQNLMKIIKLIAECAFLCDFSLGPYPHYGPHCEIIAQHIVHALSGLKTQDKLRAIHNIDPEWLGFRVTYLMTCKEVDWIPSERITIDNLVSLCCHVLGGTAEEDPNEGEVRRPPLVTQNKTRRLHAGTGAHNITERNELGNTRLKNACSMNDTKLVLKLLRQPDVDVSVTDSDGWTALHEAVFKGSTQCIRALLSHKPKEGKKPVNIRAKNIKGITPLMCAVMENKLEAAKLLLRYGGISILHDKNSQGKTAIALAKSAEMKKLLHDYTTKASNVHVSLLAISLAKLLIPFYIRIYKIQHICKPHFQKTVKSSPLVLDLILFKKEIADLKKLKYALENLPYLTEYDYLIDALSTGTEEHGE